MDPAKKICVNITDGSDRPGSDRDGGQQNRGVADWIGTSVVLPEIYTMRSNNICTIAIEKAEVVHLGPIVAVCDAIRRAEHVAKNPATVDGITPVDIVNAVGFIRVWQCCCRVNRRDWVQGIAGWIRRGVGCPDDSGVVIYKIEIAAGSAWARRAGWLCEGEEWVNRRAKIEY